MTEAVAVAHPNIALSKYWGKLPSGPNLPAVPSLSVTLDGLSTRTRVHWRRDLGSHRVTLGGRPLDPAGTRKAEALLDVVRAAAGLDACADVSSNNDFPTAGGLASSASGFAAMALAAVRSAGLDWDAARVSDLARRASASAARSVFGGYVELEGAVARPVAPCDQLPLAVLVCITTEEQKAVGSSEGMRLTIDRSPYAASWLETAPRIHAHLRAALLARDFDSVGRLAEESFLAMHACAIGAGLIYFTGATLDLLSAVGGLRRSGARAYATVDAGPHVKILVHESDLARARHALSLVPGVLRVVEARPGDGAHIDGSAAAP
jgi:diphosphomevalonate decarboxylase